MVSRGTGVRATIASSSHITQRSSELALIFHISSGFCLINNALPGNWFNFKFLIAKFSENSRKKRSWQFCFLGWCFHISFLYKAGSNSMRKFWKMWRIICPQSRAHWLYWWFIDVSSMHHWCLVDATPLLSMRENIENMDETLMQHRRVINVYDVRCIIDDSLCRFWALRMSQTSIRAVPNFQ